MWLPRVGHNNFHTILLGCLLLEPVTMPWGSTSSLWKDPWGEADKGRSWDTGDSQCPRASSVDEGAIKKADLPMLSGAHLADATWTQTSLPHQTLSKLQIHELNKQCFKLCFEVLCNAAVGKQEKQISTSFLLSRPIYSTASCTYSHDCPKITLDLKHLGSSTSTLNIEIPPEMSLPSSLCRKAC